MKAITTFPRREEYEKAISRLDGLSIAYLIVSPCPGYERVGVEGVVVEQEMRARFFQETGAEIVCSGWVDYRPSKITVPAVPPPTFEEDVFGACAIMAVAPWVADPARIRIVVHLAPIFSGKHAYLRVPFVQISASLGLVENSPAAEEDFDKV